MESTSKKPIIVIVGQTTSGKSALAMRLALKHGGEIIAADSRTVYKGMDIGTAKPSLADQEAVAHHGLDLIEPSESFSAAQFKDYANRKVNEILSLGKLPIIVGGSGLYIDGYIYDYSFADEPEPYVRAEISSLNLKELQALAEQKGLDSNSINFQNPRHLQRAIEREGQPQTRKPKPKNVLLIGLEISKEELDKRIEQRVKKMFDEGLITEVHNLINVYGVNAPGLQAPGYKAINEYIKKQLSEQEAVDLFIKYDKNLAKRQKTWFKRNKDIRWCATEQQCEQLVDKFLAQFATIDE